MSSKISRWAGIALLILAGVNPLHAAPVLSVDDANPTAGYFQLSWDAELPPGSLLQQSTSNDFTTALNRDVSGATAFSMSGLGNGAYYYRLQSAGDNSFSNTIAVNVKHHSLTKAWLFFTTGAVLFVFLISYIFLQNRRAN